MTKSNDELLDWLELQIATRESTLDLVDLAPQLTIDDAYRLQFALMRRFAQRGDRMIGYKAAYTNVAMQQAFGMPGPNVGSLLQSGYFREDQPISIPGESTNIEPEIAALMARDLAGPGVTPDDALAAVASFLPALEVAPPPVGGRQKRSRQMGTAVHKTAGGIVVGEPLNAPRGIDLRLEGAVISVNGRPKGSGTGVEVLGNPLNVIAFMANLLGQYGEKLAAGMIVMTGSVTTAVPVVPGDDVRVEFTRLGSVGARFTN